MHKDKARQTKTLSQPSVLAPCPCTLYQITWNQKDDFTTSEVQVSLFLGLNLASVGPSNKVGQNMQNRLLTEKAKAQLFCLSLMVQNKTKNKQAKTTRQTEKDRTASFSGANSYQPTLTLASWMSMTKRKADESQ